MNNNIIKINKYFMIIMLLEMVVFIITNQINLIDESYKKYFVILFITTAFIWYIIEQIITKKNKK